MNTNVNELAEIYRKTFEEEPDLERLSALIKFWSFEKVNDALHYVYINGYRKPLEGEKHNPYGLIYSLCHKINFKH